MVATARTAEPIHYPESDNMGEHELQRRIVTLLLPLLERWLSLQKRTAHAGADQFFYWAEGDTGKRRAPDVYAIDGVPQDRDAVGSWKVWQGHSPHFALEVCGDDWEKDYDEAPADYARMGTRELVVFDPGATTRSRRRVRWQLFRAREGEGLVRVHTGNEQGVYSEELRCWLRAVREGRHPVLRLATHDADNALVPTEAEFQEREKERERLAKEAALAEAESLRRELEALRRAGR